MSDEEFPLGREGIGKTFWKTIDLVRFKVERRKIQPENVPLQ